MKNSQDTEKQEEILGGKKYLIYKKHNNKAKTEHLIPQRRGGGGDFLFCPKGNVPFILLPCLGQETIFHGPS